MEVLRFIAFALIYVVAFVTILRAVHELWRD